MSKNNNNADISKTGKATPDKEINLSRRKFTKAGLIASPILASLPGKSALAGNCTSLSGMLSGNLSAPDNAVSAECNGKLVHIDGWGPGYWRAVCPRLEAFPIGYQETDFLADFFGIYGVITPPSGDYTLLEVLWLQPKHVFASPEVIELTQHTIAAFFSAIKSAQYFIGQDQIIEMYRATVGGGVYFEPVTGIQLTLTDIIAIYKDSYVGAGNAIASPADTNFCKTTGYKYDDRNGKGHFYIKEAGIPGFFRLFADGSRIQWKNR